MSKDRAPRLKEQHKDFPVEVEKAIPASAELQKKRMEHKEEELQANPRMTAELHKPEAEGENHG